jgi:WD40 repeat protein
VRVLEGHGDWVNTLRTMGPLVLSGSVDKTIRVWNAAVRRSDEASDSQKAIVGDSRRKSKTSEPYSIFLFFSL